MLRPLDYDPELDRVQIIGPARTGVQPWELKWLVQAVQRTRGNVLEIGTHYGDTARELALQFPQRRIICVDKCSPDHPEINAQTVCRSARNLPNVTLKIMDSRDFVYEPKDDLSLIFIDGDHSWEGVRGDTDKAMAYLRGRHGSIVWHDCMVGCQVLPYLKWRADHGDVIYSVRATSLAFYHC